MIWTICVFLGGVYIAQEYPGLPVVKETFNSIMKYLVKEEVQKSIIEKLTDVFKK